MALLDVPRGILFYSLRRRGEQRFERVRGWELRAVLGLVLRWRLDPAAAGHDAVMHDAVFAVQDFISAVAFEEPDVAWQLAALDGFDVGDGGEVAKLLARNVFGFHGCSPALAMAASIASIGSPNNFESTWPSMKSTSRQSGGMSGMPAIVLPSM